MEKSTLTVVDFLFRKVDFLFLLSTFHRVNKINLISNWRIFLCSKCKVESEVELAAHNIVFILYTP